MPITVQSNIVELIGFYGGDMSHALSAWTSTRRDLTQDKEDRIGPFLASLAQNGHHTPFEKSALHFLCTTDIATHIHLLKHRIGVSVNSESARYKELVEDKFYVPSDWSQKSQNRLLQVYEAASEAYHEILKEEEHHLGRKRAKESARFALPYGMQLNVDVQFNFRSFMHFCGLRLKAGAQKEVRDLSRTMLSLVEDIPGNPFNLSLSAFSSISLKEASLYERWPYELGNPEDSQG